MGGPREGKESGPRTHWKVQLEPSLYVPAKKSGAKICSCKVQHPQDQGKNNTTPEQMPYFTWAEEDCTMKDSVRDTCFHVLTDVDVARYSYLLDEVPTWVTP